MIPNKILSKEILIINFSITQLIIYANIDVFSPNKTIQKQSNQKNYRSMNG